MRVAAAAQIWFRQTALHHGFSDLNRIVPLEFQHLPTALYVYDRPSAARRSARPHAATASRLPKAENEALAAAQTTA